MVSGGCDVTSSDQSLRSIGGICMAPGSPGEAHYVTFAAGDEPVRCYFPRWPVWGGEGRGAQACVSGTGGERGAWTAHYGDWTVLFQLHCSTMVSFLAFFHALYFSYRGRLLSSCGVCFLLRFLCGWNMWNTDHRFSWTMLIVWRLLLGMQFSRILEDEF